MGRWGSWRAAHVQRRSERQRQRNRKHPKSIEQLNSWPETTRIEPVDETDDGMQDEQRS